MKTKQEKGFAIVETTYFENGNIEEIDTLSVGEIGSWRDLQKLVELIYQKRYMGSLQYEISWDDDSLGFSAFDTRLGHVVSDVRALITDFVEL